MFNPNYVSPFIYANRRGIPRFASDSLTATTTSATFNFDGFPQNTNNYCGLILFKLSQSLTGVTDTLPVVFNLGGTDINLTYLDDTDVTVANLGGTGVYLVFFDCQSNTLQLLTGYSA